MKSTAQITSHKVQVPTILAVVVLTIATAYLAFVPEQSDFIQIISSGSIAFLAYFYLAYNRLPSTRYIFATGVLIRVLLLFAFPNLSDDIYRFVWDGYLTKLGMNPYSYLPSELLGDLTTDHMTTLIEHMNSPEYYTIYPPFTQLIFYLSTIFEDNLVVSSMLIKATFLVAEIFTFYGLVRLLGFMNRDERLAAIYFLNPLVIVEGIGNLHFEIIMASFLIWSIYFLFVRKNILIGALLLTLSIASKLLPLMFLPYFLFRLDGNKRIKFFGWGLLFIVIAFLPIAIGLDFANFGSSIDLYFQKFEFNGGIYYFFRHLGQVYSGYNLIHIIGPFLGISAVCLILWKAYRSEAYHINTFITFAFFSFCTYLLLATTIHPWYLIIPILLSVFVAWRFAVLWSFLILMTYINYSYEPYHENLWIVSLEYLSILSFIIYEWKYKKNVEVSDQESI